MRSVDRRRIERLFLCRLLVISLVICIAGVMSRAALARDPNIAVTNRDKDGDGRVGRDEWNGTAEVFAKIDVNHDNYLSVDEFSAHFSALENSDVGKKKVVEDKKSKPKTNRTQTVLKKMDENGDGVVAEDEWKGQAGVFGKIDGDGDTILTVKELSAYFGAPEGPRGGEKQKGGAGNKPTAEGKNPNTVVKNMDKDGDGLIAREEWTGQAEAYDQIDTDRDDRLTVKELAAFFSASDGSQKSGGKGKDPNTVVKNMDKDGDGLIAREEWKGKAEAYDQIDADRDNRLTVKELAAFYSTLENSEGKKDKKVKLMSAIKSMDKNRDSKIARDEWTGPAKQFDTIDANRDNQLTTGELAALLVKQMDKDGNGKLKRGETTFPAEPFGLLDRDGDDQLSAKELAAVLGWESITKNR